MENDRMVDWLGSFVQQLEVTPGVASGFGDGIEEFLSGYVMGTAIRGEDSTGREGFEGAQMEFAVAFQGLGNCLPVPGKRWRIQNDQIKFLGAIFGEPIKQIGLKEMDIQLVFPGVALGPCNGGSGNVDADDLAGPCPGCIEGEGTLVATTIEDPPVLGKGRDLEGLLALIQIESGFLATREVEPIPNSINFDPEWIEGLSGGSPDIQGQPFQLSTGSVISKENIPWLELLCDPFLDDTGLRIGTKGHELDHKDILVLIDNDTGQAIRFRPDDPLKFLAFLPVSVGFFQGFADKIGIPVGCGIEFAPDDLRGGVENPVAQRSVL